MATPPTHTIKQGDTAPPIRATLTAPNGGVQDLTGATVAFNMKKGAVLVVDHASCTIEGVATAGTVSYTPTALETATAGDYDAEFVVTFGAGQVLTFPNNGNMRVHVQAQVA